MKITIYNDAFSFSENLDASGFFENDYDDLDVKNYYQSADPIDCLIKDLRKDHPVYGWWEQYYQSDRALDIYFTHIKFEKNA